MAKISVILPTYNERENLPILIKQLAENLREYDYEIVVVDDNSPDGTAEVAESMSRQYPVKVVKRPGKMGYASAVYDGIKESTGDFIVIMDADLQHPPRLVPRLVERIGECDVVVGSRYIKGGGVREWGLLRRVVSIGAVVLARLMIPECRSVRDPVSGFFAIRRDIVSTWRPITNSGYKVLVEILYLTKPSKICEEPYVFSPRKRGRSKLSLRVVFSFIEMMLKISISRISRRLGYLILL